MAGRADSVSGWGTKILHIKEPKKKKKNPKRIYWCYFNLRPYEYRHYFFLMLKLPQNAQSALGH